MTVLYPNHVHPLDDNWAYPGRKAMLLQLVLPYAVVVASMLCMVIFQSVRWKDPYRAKTLTILVFAELALPFVGMLRWIGDPRALEFSVAISICVNLSWAVASGLDPLGPWMDNPRIGNDPWAPDHYWKWDSRRRPTILFWPAFAILFFASSMTFAGPIADQFPN